MRATFGTSGAIIALVMLAACGGMEPNPKPNLTSKELALSGVISFEDGYAKVNLDVSADGEWARDAQVELNGHAVAFDEAHSGYCAEIPVDALPAGERLHVKVSLGQSQQERDLTIPGAFGVVAPESVEVDTDFGISWSQSANATGYRAQLKPEGGAVRGGELTAETRTYLFNGLAAAGSADLSVMAVAQNLAGDSSSTKVEVIRVDRRTINIIETVPETAKLEVSGLVHFEDGLVKVNLDVLADGEWTEDAQVELNGHTLAFDASRFGYYAEIAVSAFPAGEPLDLEVSLGQSQQSRELIVPGTFQVVAPDSVEVDTEFEVSWSQSANASGYRAFLKPEGEATRGGELGAQVRAYTFNGLSAAGSAELTVTAFAQHIAGDAASTRIEVIRVDRRTVDIVEEKAVQISVSGLGTISKYHSELALTVTVDGQQVTDAQVQYGNTPLTASESGLFEIFQGSTAPLFVEGRELRVRHSGKEIVRTLAAPGEYTLTTPGMPANPSGSDPLSVEWTAARNADVYEVTVVSANNANPILQSRVKSLNTTFSATGWTGLATLHMHAVSINDAGAGLGSIEVHRTIERNLLFQ